MAPRRPRDHDQAAGHRTDAGGVPAAGAPVVRLGPPVPPTGDPRPSCHLQLTPLSPQDRRRFLHAAFPGCSGQHPAVRLCPFAGPADTAQTVAPALQRRAEVSAQPVSWPWTVALGCRRLGRGTAPLPLPPLCPSLPKSPPVPGSPLCWVRAQPRDLAVTAEPPGKLPVRVGPGAGARRVGTSACVLGATVEPLTLPCDLVCVTDFREPRFLAQQTWVRMGRGEDGSRAPSELCAVTAVASCPRLCPPGQHRVPAAAPLLLSPPAACPSPRLLMSLVFSSNRSSSSTGQGEAKNSSRVTWWLRTGRLPAKVPERPRFLGNESHCDAGCQAAANAARAAGEDTSFPVTLRVTRCV